MVGTARNKTKKTQTKQTTKQQTNENNEKNETNEIYETDWLTKSVCVYMLRVIRLMGQDCISNGYADEYEGDGRQKMTNGDPRKLMKKAKDLITFGEDYSASDFLAIYEQHDPYQTLEAYICNTEFPVYTKGTGVICIRTSPLHPDVNNGKRKMCARLQNKLKNLNLRNQSNSNSNSNDNSNDNSNNNSNSKDGDSSIMDDICSNECGIRKNEFIVPFLGEVYPPWRWYERTDRIKYLEKSKGAEEQPDFYNMMLERHKDDENGFNLVFVDPSKKGNFASRISHGCKPNCIVTTMATNGRFKIAVFATRDIRYGEELCFDYNSTTEDEKESKSAICLCGTSHCRGSYYYWVGTGAYQDILKTEHHFLYRTAGLFNACKNYYNNINITNQDKENFFNKYNIGKAVFGKDGHTPKWLINYALEILKYIEKESQLLPIEIRKQWKDNDAAFISDVWKKEKEYKNIKQNYIEKLMESNSNSNDNSNTNGNGNSKNWKQYKLNETEQKEIKELQQQYIDAKLAKRNEDAKISSEDETVGVQQSRLQTLVITINRVLYFFSNEDNNKIRNIPPLIILSDEEIIHKLWYDTMSPIQQFLVSAHLEGDENHPIIQNIENFMKTKTPPNITTGVGNAHKEKNFNFNSIIKYTNKNQTNSNNNSNNNSNSNSNSNSNDNSNSNSNSDSNSSNGKKKSNIITIEESRTMFRWIRDELYKLASTNASYHHACADLFHFYGNTKYWFSSNNYYGFQSKPFSYRELGYTKPGNADGKKYGTQYVWGQLAFWERQTIEAPDASLSQQRRGTVTLPSIESCYSRSKKSSLNKKYNCKERKDMIEWISNETKRANPWTTKTHWSFRNGKLYGSPWLDRYVDPINESEKLNRVIDQLRNFKVKYPNGECTSINEKYGQRFNIGMQIGASSQSSGSSSSASGSPSSSSNSGSKSGSNSNSNSNMNSNANSNANSASNSKSGSIESI